MDDEFETVDVSKERGDTVDLSADNSLIVDISDALSEKDKVKFTVHTKTTMSTFAKPEIHVTRQHEEFLWLHDRFEENESYAGIIIPPSPPRPNFDASRDKLQKLGDGEGTMTKDEFAKMKAELEAEYLATFKKTVAMHEVFLQRLASHNVLKTDETLKVFLEYDGELNVRGKNTKEKFSGFFKTVSKTADDLFIVDQTDDDEFFVTEKRFLLDYLAKIKDATAKADRNVKYHKSVADMYIKLSSGFTDLSEQEPSNSEDLHVFYDAIADFYEKLRKFEGRVATDADLKLSDTLRYYSNDSCAARELLHRRARALFEYESSNKALEKARQKGKEVRAAEQAQEEAFARFERISEVAKVELQQFKERRITYFRKNLVDLADLQTKHSKAEIALLKTTLAKVRDLDVSC